MDKFVDKIKTATGWERVAKVNNSYVLSFNMSDIPVIKGLIIDQSADTFYLEFKEFTPLPISFLIDIGNSRNQYWTVTGTGFSIELTGRQEKPYSVMREKNSTNFPTITKKVGVQ